MTEGNITTPLHSFTELEKDALKEIGNISLGSAATVLSQLISRRVSITTPHISYQTISEIHGSFKAPCVVVAVKYIQGLSGSNLFIVNKNDAVIIGQLMMMEEPDPAAEISEIHLSAISEAMNQMMGAAATAMSDVFDTMINISAPEVNYRQIDVAVTGIEPEGYILVAFRIEVEGLIDSELVQLLPIGFSREIVNFLIGKYSEENIPVENVVSYSSELDFMLSEDTASYGQENIEYASTGGMAAEDAADGEFALINNIRLEVKGVAGKIRMPLGQVLQLDRGSVVLLDSEPDDGVVVLINGKPIAKAEIVAVGNQYGLRLTKSLKNGEDE